MLFLKYLVSDVQSMTVMICLFLELVPPTSSLLATFCLPTCPEPGLGDTGHSYEMWDISGRRRPKISQ